MSNDISKLLEAFERLENGQKTIQSDIANLTVKVGRLENTVAHIDTALKVVPTKQDIEVAIDAAKNELKADIHHVDANVLNLDAKVSRKLQSHERRISNIEEHEGIENPEKN